MMVAKNTIIQAMVHVPVRKEPRAQYLFVTEYTSKL